MLHICMKKFIKLTLGNVIMLKSVIFDFDGVIIDSELFWRKAELEILNNLGYHVTYQEVLKNSGKRVEELVAEWQTKFNFSANLAGYIAKEIYNQAQKNIINQAIPKIGLHKTIKFLLTKKMRLAIASSSPISIIKLILEKFSLNGFFEIICSAENEIYGKPHPAVFLKACSLLKLKPYQCLVIEDSLSGIIAAKAARMKCILMPNSFGSISINAFIDQIIDDFAGFDNYFNNEFN